MPGSPSNDFELTIKRGSPSSTAARKSLSSSDETRDVVPAPSSAFEAANATQARVAKSVGPAANPTPAANSLPIVPGYVLNQELARGGMGVVFTARDKVLNREVAVKTLLPAATINPVAFRRFVTEARITARLSHPGIPPVYALGALPDGRPFLAMKLIRGRTLGAVLAARQSRAAATEEDGELTALHAPGLLHIFEQICQAVGYAHSQDVIHRDLKPANVMLGSFGEVLVMDWGLARETGRGNGTGQHSPLNSPDSEEAGSEDTGIHALDDTEQSRIGEALGTPAFMPPEQACGEWDKVDARADVFALGGILCVILTGLPPYTGRNVHEVIRRAVVADLDEAFARLDSCGADPDLIALAKQCLSPEREDRLPNAAALAVALQSHNFENEERIRRLATARATTAVREAERRAKAVALAAVRKAAEERLQEAEREAKARETQKLHKHWTMTAIIVLGMLLAAYTYQYFRDTWSARPTETQQHAPVDSTLQPASNTSNCR